MRFITLLFCLGISPLFAQDTFSIIAADPETGEIGAAGATCVDGIANFGGIQILNKIIPGRGGVNAQAYICINPHVNLDLAIEQLEDGLSAQEVIDWLQQNDGCFSQSFNPAYRQYGILDFDVDGNIRTAAFTGENTDDYHGHRTGATYSIQGNILLGPEVLDGMEDGFNNTEGSLAERLMAAMQGANFAGADARCLDRGTSSTSAFLRVVRPTDEMNSPFLELNVLEMPFGEEPIDSLQVLFDEWSVINDVSYIDEQAIKIFPNPSYGRYTLSLQASLEAQEAIVSDTSGKKIWQADLTGKASVDIDLSTVPSGLYWLTVKLDNGTTQSRRLVKY